MSNAIFSQTAPIILASASPRRKDLLESVGLTFSVLHSNISEDILVGETPDSVVTRLAVAKAQHIADQYPDHWVVGADTIVVCDGRIFGKPVSVDDAVQMLSALQGREHEVYGGIAVLCQKRDYQEVQCHVSRVGMIAMTRAQIISYVSTGEPLDKAGAYAIQGLGTQLVGQVNGSYTNVVGLNVSALVTMLRMAAVLTDGAR